MNTSNMLKNKHLSYEDRKTIEKSLNNGLNFSQIGSNINKPYKFLKPAQPLVYMVLNCAINLINRHMFAMDVLLEMDAEEKNIITMQMMLKLHIMIEKVILEKE